MFTCFIQKLGWFAGHIAGLGVPFVVHHPSQLRDELAIMLKRASEAIHHP
ncbi:MAG: hypothetical protein SH821_08090 [Phototrophicales bacterium]|nr:hypothetical protein [Phototrophicales bacterium]